MRYSWVIQLSKKKEKREEKELVTNSKTLPTTTQKYNSFFLEKLVFIDITDNICLLEQNNLNIFLGKKLNSE